LITNFTGHSSDVWSVAFSPDGTKVVSGSSDNTAKVLEFSNVTKLSMKRKWVFEPGVGTGNINEFYLESNSYNGWSNTPVARQVLDNTIIKESYHRLEFEWEIIFNKTKDTFTGIITSGGRDGITDITYKTFIGSMAFIGAIINRSYRPLFGIYGSDIFIGAEDNSDVDLSFDNYASGGSSPYEITPQPYTTDSFQREFRIGFDTTHLNLTNGIGKIAFRDNNNNAQFAITFTPPLDKVNTFRLYLDFLVSLTAN